MSPVNIQRTIQKFISSNLGRIHCSSSLCSSGSSLVNSRFFWWNLAFRFQEKVRQAFFWQFFYFSIIEFSFRYVTDGTIAIFVSILPLIIPNKNPFETNWEYRPILPWNFLSITFPWNVFVLQGAGLAIANGFKVIRWSFPTEMQNVNEFDCLGVKFSTKFDQMFIFP